MSLRGQNCYLGLGWGWWLRRWGRHFPSGLGRTAKGYRDLTIRGFEALTVEAMKELRAENQELKSENQELRAMIKKLARRIEVVEQSLSRMK